MGCHLPSATRVSNKDLIQYAENANRRASMASVKPQEFLHCEDDESSITGSVLSGIAS
jgi:hypothetical protein